jgi:hypothetical protein
VFGAIWAAVIGLGFLVFRRNVAQQMFDAKPPGVRSPEELIPAAVACGILASLSALAILLLF